MRCSYDVQNREFRRGISYDDVLLVPQRSPVDHRNDVDTTTSLTPGLELDVPILSSAMDSVTESETAIALSRAGGLGVVHRFMTVEEQASEIRSVDRAGERVGAAVGIDGPYLERTEAVLDAGADCVVVDIAHGHMEWCLDAVEHIRAEFPDVDLIAGVVATEEAVRDLAAAGADSIMVGVGAGSHCTTREVAGVGVPQLTAVLDCSDAAAECGVTTIASGGIRKSGEIVKALAAGADAVMIGGLLAGTEEAPGETVERDGQLYKKTRGSASAEANVKRTDKDDDDALVGAEGVSALTEYVGPLADVVEDLVGGVQGGMSYCGAHDVETLRENAEFIRTSAGAKLREGEHGDGLVRRD